MCLLFGVLVVICILVSLTDYLKNTNKNISITSIIPGFVDKSKFQYLLSEHYTYKYEQKITQHKWTFQDQISIIQLTEIVPISKFLQKIFTHKER